MSNLKACWLQKMNPTLDTSNPTTSSPLAVTQYEVASIRDDAVGVEVVYTDNDGLIYKRTVNVPRDSEGNLIQELFDEILEAQLAGVNNKRAVGVAVFKDASEYEEAEQEENPGEEALT